MKCEKGQPLSLAHVLEMALERTAEAGKTTDQVRAPGDRGLDEVKVSRAHEVLGVRHFE